MTQKQQVLAGGYNGPIMTLNNGIKMPQVGLGTFLIPNEKLSTVIEKPMNWGIANLILLGDIIMKKR